MNSEDFNKNIDKISKIADDKGKDPLYEQLCLFGCCISVMADDQRQKAFDKYVEMYLDGELK
jgi:hypothetical protein